MRNLFSTRSTGYITLFLFLSLFYFPQDAHGQCPSGTLSGNVFLDQNNDGLNDPNEAGQSSVLVRAINAQGAQVGQAISNQSGVYTISGLTNGESYRLQFALTGTSQVSTLGSDNGGDVQFATAPSCDNSLGVSASNTTCGGETEIFLSCFVNGLGTNSPNQETIIGLVNSFNPGSPVNVYARQSETGAVWGLVYKEASSEIFTSAFVKQHASLGTGGHDAIYRTDVSTGNPSTTVFAKLSQLGQNVGNLAPSNSSSCNYGKQVGKIGLGGLVLDDTGDNLYVTNLFDNSVVKVSSTNPTAATTTRFSVPNPGCSYNDFRIFGLKYYNGSLYVGVVCTGETSQVESDTRMHVYQMNPSSGNFNLIFSDDFSKGFWSDNKIQTRGRMQWLTDIDFTDNGDMLLSLSDRLGHAYCDGNTSRVDEQRGDLLVAANVNGNWVLESNGSVNGLTGNGVGNGQGPGGGEFFGDDFFPSNPTDHSETSLGSIYVLPGSGEVISAVFDPALTSYSGGLHRYDTSNGSLVAYKQLYNQNISNYFGKATGFGDIYAGCGPLDAQIGNYVWFDTDCDGEQDAGEAAAIGISVQLYDSQCNLIAMDQTDANGNYSFTAADGVLVGKQYYVVLDPSLFDGDAGSYEINSTYYFPTSSNNNIQFDSNLQTGSSCSNLGNAPYVAVETGQGNDLSFDIGLKPSTNFDLALIKRNVSGVNPKFGELLEFEIQIINQGTVAATSFDISDYIPSGLNFVPSENQGWTLNGSTATLSVNSILLPGDTYTTSIFLSLEGSSLDDDLTNYAEISATVDANGAINSDVDSTADSDNTNDAGGLAASPTDDKIDDDGTIDEDDHDPAMVYIFDLALTKTNRDNRPYDIGETVIFDIIVYNQGNVDAASFTVTDNYPVGLTFVTAGNSGWNPSGPQMLEYFHSSTLASGESVTIPVSFQIESTEDQLKLMNYAEISAATSSDNQVVDDFDSTPDSDMFNDAGGEPDGQTDGVTEFHGVEDEDDHDPASLAVRTIDLALIKTTRKTTFGVGDVVTYSIEVHNQGTTAISKIELIDYLPQNMTLVDNSWTLSADGTTASKEVVFLGGLAPGAVITEEIVMRINDDTETGVAYINVAEISKVFDQGNRDVSGSDMDSTPDSINGNDSGGMPVSAMDDYLDGTGFDDEDDSDPALIFVPKVELVEECFCLNNASNAHDGQFRDSIKVTSLSGEDWYIDSEFEFFDIASAPGAPVPYVTGPGGVTFTEVPNADGVTSCYFLSGKHVTGVGYTLRTTNGSTFLNVTGGGDCSYCSPQVSGDGLGAVCAGSTHTYTADVSDPKYADCVGFSWFIDGGGSIINMPGTNSTGSGTGMTGSGTAITIAWDNNIGEHNLVFIPHCPNDCVAPVNLTVQVGTDSTEMACIHEINVSLGDDCKSILTPDDFLVSAPMAGVVYQLMLTDAYGDLIQNNKVTEEHLWTRLTAKVINPCSGNSCWAYVNVEDKLPPRIQCDSIILPCYALDTYRPIVIDACSTAEFNLISETTTPLPCSDDHIKEVHRTYTAVDGYGNVSQPCTQTISLEPLPAVAMNPDSRDSIIIPPSFLVIDSTSLSCQGLILDEFGFPDPSLTGVPTINGRPIFPITDLYCNAGIDYRDVLLKDFGCIRKIMRTWTFYDGCGEPVRRTQTIEIADSRAPWVTCPDDVTINTDGGPGCQAEYTVPLPEITDDCTVDNFEIDLKYANGFLNDINSEQNLTFLSSDSTHVTYKVYDQCGNLSACTFNVVVMDNISPTAICDQNSVVSLRLDGTAKAFPQTFDDGSYDDCALVKTIIRRMNTDCGCDRPRFDDMHYLGTRNGRFYYLSSGNRLGFKAFSLANAHGGMLLTLETPEEHTWVNEQVTAYAPGCEYFIGLRDKNGTDEFTWGNHAKPTFNRWSDGTPDSADGDYVIVDNNGEWKVVSNQEHKFVLELSNGCGFSDEVSFCCADAGKEQMIVLRAIDHFGSFNDCMVNVEVQDKVPPIISCPDDVVLNCSDLVDINNLGSFGIATATDQCVGDSITVEVVVDRDNCGIGTISRIFTANDANGGSQCIQVLTFENDDPFDLDNIIWPADFDTDLGCDFGALAPENLEEEFAFPRYDRSDVCDLLDATFKDQTFSFAGPGSTACLKILRKWTVIDWCQTDANGLPFTEVYDQTIKVQNTEGPMIDETACEDVSIVTLECLNAQVNFDVSATDDCTDATSLRNQVNLDLGNDGNVDFSSSWLIGGTIPFEFKVPLGNHRALFSFEDLCGNVSSCTKLIEVKSEKAPVAYCKESITIALEPWADNEVACITPAILDAGSFHPCNPLILQENLLFPGSPMDTIKYDVAFCDNPDPYEMCFDCRDRDSIRTVRLCVIDEFENAAYCNVRVKVEDNNGIDNCPEFDLALVKELAPGSPSLFNPGDDVTFRISVFNQGNVEANNISLADYVPNGLILNDPDWTISQGSNTALLTNPIASLAVGAATSVQITFTIDPNGMELCYVNFAEIIQAENAMNLPDEDSTADTNQNNDIVGGDNTVDNQDGDEDDHDFAKVFINQIFDLALEKTLSDPSIVYMPGDQVCYDITVTNQGTLNATTVTIQDDIPAGLTLVPGIFTDLGNTAVYTVPFIAAGTSETVQICFNIQNGFMGECIVNVAQIVDLDGSDLDDVDSTPGNDNGDQSEDDEDSEKLTVGQRFDLALIKRIAPGGPAIYNPGDNVTFTIDVFNQGTLDAQNVVITDYIPSDLIFNQADNPLWTSAGTINVGNVPIGPNPVSVTLVLQIAPGFIGNSILNDAEISNAINSLGMPDADSMSGDNATPNDLAADDDVNDMAGGDDQDPAQVNVVCDIPPVCRAFDQVVIALDTFGFATVNVSQVDNGSSSICDNMPPRVEIVGDSIFDCSDLFCVINVTRTITIRVTDQSGNTSECNSNVTVNDNIAPFFSCNDVTVSLDTNGNPIIDTDDIINTLPAYTFIDNCDVNDITVSTVGVLPCDPNPATLAVTDQCGNSSSCSFNVFIENDIPPVCTLVNSATFSLDSFGRVTIDPNLLDAGSMSVCGNDPVILEVVGDDTFGCNDLNCVNNQVQTITIRVTDPSNNVTTICSTDVRILDEIAPFFQCSDVTVPLNPDGSPNIDLNEVVSNIPGYNIQDNCTIVTSNLSNVSATPCIANIATLTLIDQCNNSTTCTFNVFIENNLPPICSLVTNGTFNLDTFGTVTIDPNLLDAGSMSVCGSDPVILEVVGNAIYDCDDLNCVNNQVQTITIRVTDSSNNVTTICSTDVRILDEIAPFFQCNDVTVPLNPDGTPNIDLSEVVINLPGFNGQDNCSVVSSNLNNVSATPCIANIATLTLVDQCNNSATCTFNVFIENNLPPICSLVTNGAFNLDTFGTVTIDPNLLDAGSMSVCGSDPVILEVVGNAIYDCDDLNCINNQVQTITIRVTDPSNNVTTICSTDVRILDDIAPFFQCNDVTVPLNPDGTPNIDLVQVVSNVPGYNNQENCTIISSNLSNVSSTPCVANLATLTVTDQCNNSATCTFNVFIENDAPVAICTPDLTVSLNGSGTGTVAVNQVDNGSTDDCGIISREIEPSVFDCDDVNASGLSVTLTVTDINGSSDVCITSVVVTDNIPPVARCRNFELCLDGNGNATLVADSLNLNSTDNCPQNISFSVDRTMFDCNDVGGPVSVVFTVSDGTNTTMNSSCSVTVTDKEAPVLTCRDRTVFVSPDINGQITILPSLVVTRITDNCGGSIDTTITPNIISCADLGTTGNGCPGTVEVSVTASDGFNIAECTQTVTVRDNTPPECNEIAGLEFSLLGAGTTASITLNSSQFFNPTDNCSTVIDFTPETFTYDCTDRGVNTVTVTIEDACRNRTTCTNQITILDGMPICAAIPDVTFALDPNGNFFVDLMDVDNGSSAGCNGMITFDPGFFGCNDLNSNASQCVTLTVTPASGIDLTCKSNVTVIDTTAPVLTCQDITLNLNSIDNDPIPISALDDAMIDDLDLTIIECDTASIVLSQNSIDCSDLADSGPGCQNDVEVTMTVTDGSGNSSICVSTVTVMDNVAPTCTGRQGVTVPLIMMGTTLSVDLDAQALVATYDDNCDDINFTASAMPASFDCNQVNTTQTITLTVTDACGLSGTCTATVDIIENTVPICLAQDVTVALDGTELCLDPTLVDAGSNSGCNTPVILSVSPDKFDCSDLGPNTVTLTVTTDPLPPNAPQSSSCTATVTIVDNTLPTIECPADTTLNCDADLSDLTDYGNPEFSDGCNSTMPSLFIATPIIDVNTCSVGTVIRSFTVTDGDGNTASCSQTITISPPSPALVEADITWPVSPFVLDTCIMDPTNIISGFPVVDESNAECSSISIGFTTIDPTPNSGSMCVNELIRTFTVIDSCQLNVSAGSGIFTFQQTIVLNDVEGPDLVCPNDTTLFLAVNNQACEVFVDLPAMITDCTGVLGGTNDSPFALTMMSANAAGNYPGGTTQVTVTGEDNCGNLSMCTYAVMVVDTFAVIDTCKKIVISLGQTGVAQVTPDLSCISVSSPCNMDSFQLSYSPVDPTFNSFFVDCTDFAAGIVDLPTYLFSGGLLIDSCVNLLQVVDPFMVCTEPLLGGGINGSVFTEDARMVSEVTVELNNMGMEDVTLEDGHYAFKEVPFEHSYQIVPQKDMDPLNGISTLDLLLIQRHILGIETLDSPYKIIAADINRSNSLNGIDLVELRKLILGINLDFNENTSWRMVDAAYEFKNPQDPFDGLIPEKYILQNFVEDMEVDFIGVKIGDVSGDVVANLNDLNIENRSPYSAGLRVTQQPFARNTEAELEFAINSDEAVEGFQYTLSFDTDKVEVLEFSPLLSELSTSNVNLQLLSEGIIHFSWHTQNNTGLKDELTDIFNIKLAILEDSWTEDIVTLSESGLKAEAYVGTEIRDLRMEYVPMTSESMVLYQNCPNPWSQSTQIKFNLGTDKEFNFKMRDTNGKLIISKTDMGVRGINIIDIKADEIESGGVYYYELTSGNEIATQKMLFVK